MRRLRESTGGELWRARGAAGCGRANLTSETLPSPSPVGHGAAEGQFPAVARRLHSAATNGRLVCVRPRQPLAVGWPHELSRRASRPAREALGLLAAWRGPAYWRPERSLSYDAEAGVPLAHARQGLGFADRKRWGKSSAPDFRPLRRCGLTEMERTAGVDDPSVAPATSKRTSATGPRPVRGRDFSGGAGRLDSRAGTGPRAAPARSLRPDGGENRPANVASFLRRAYRPAGCFT